MAKKYDYGDADRTGRGILVFLGVIAVIYLFRLSDLWAALLIIGFFIWAAEQ